MYLDLTLSLDELWNNLSHSAKYSINRARREKNTVSILSNPDDLVLEKFYALVQQTGRLKGFYVPPFKEIQARKNAFQDKSFLSLVYDEKGDLLGGKFYVADCDFVLYAVGGTSSSGRGDKSGYLLLWEAILYFKELGYSVLDLEGLVDPRFPLFTKNWEGFTHFKLKFGGQKVVFDYPYIKYFNPILKLLGKNPVLGL